MVTRNVAVRFTAEISNFKRNMADAAASTDKTKKAAEEAGKVSEKASKTASEAALKHRDAVEQVGTATTVMGAATVAGVGLAVKSYADFDKQLSAVRAATGETAGNMDLLKQAAIDAGANTAYSATEAAQGIEELAKAGVSTKDILNGGLNGALSLAAAGELAVGDAAELAASSMTQFGLSGKDIPHIADLLAAGAGKAQGSVQDMGEALNQVGLVAAQTGLSIEETTGGLAAFASAGLTGSDAGTSFKTMLAALTPNSEAAAKAMEELGISAYDSQGNFIGLSEFAGQLQGSLSDLSSEQRNATLETIFGSDAVRAAAVLYEQGAAGVEKWESAVNDAGYAAETAATMQDNLAGDLEKLGGAFDTVLLQSGSGANDVLRGMAQGAEDVVDWIGQIPAPMLSAAAGIAGVTGGAALLAGGLINVVPKIRDTKDAFDTLAPAGGRARGAIVGVGKAAGVAAGAMTALQIAGALFTERDIKSVEEFGQAMLNVGKAGSGLDTAFQGYDKMFGAEVVTNVNGMSDAVRELTNQDFNDWMNTNFADPLNTMFGMSKTHIGQVTDRFKDLGDAMGGMAKNGGVETTAKSFKVLSEEFEKNGKSAQDALNALPGYRDALQGLATEAGVALTGQELLDYAMGKVPAGMEAAATATQTYTDTAGQSKPVSEEMAKALEDIGLSANGAVTDMVKFTDSLLNAGLLQLSARDAARNYQAALDGVTASIATNGTSLDINTEQGRANQAALDAVASAGLQVVQSNAANGASQKTLQGNLVDTYNGLKDAAIQFGLTDDEAIALARDVLKVPKGVSIDSWMSSEAKRMAEQTKGALDAVDGRTVRTYAIHRETTIVDVKRSDSVQSGRGTAAKGQFDGFAMGGRLPAYADGGQLPTTGPGTETVDGFLGIDSVGRAIARVDAGEWIINSRSSDKYNRELAAINAGTFPKLPGFASGGMSRGREYSARELGFSPSMSAAAAFAGPMEMVGTLELNSDATMATFRGMARAEANGAISRADRQAQYTRVGR